MAEASEDPRNVATRNYKAQAESALARVPESFMEEAQRYYNRLKANRLSPATQYAQLQLLVHYA